MPITKEDESRSFKQLQRLNFFYAITVIAMTVSVLFLMFSINIEQRRLIERTTVLIEERAEEAERMDQRSEERLERVLERLEELERFTCQLEP